jgi:hypothetical protein
VRRFGVFSVTGYGIANDGERNAHTPRRWGTGAGIHDPITTWYVTDDGVCSEVVYETPYEHLARDEALRLNALERKYEKEAEREFSSNGHP